MEDAVKARRTRARVTFNGVDISKDIAEDLLSLSFTDSEEDEADDLQLKLADTGAVWLQKWLSDTVNAGAEPFEPEEEIPEGTEFLDTSALKASFMLDLYPQRARTYWDGVVLKSCLAALGYLSNNDINAVLSDDATISAIRAFKTQYRLGSGDKIDADGWRKLLDAVNGKNVIRARVYCARSQSGYVTTLTGGNGKQVVRIPAGAQFEVVGKGNKYEYVVIYDGKTGYYTEEQSNVVSVTVSGSGGTGGGGESGGGEIKAAKGLMIHAVIALSDENGESETDCGDFELDSIKHSGPPATVTIKGTSLPYSGGIREEKKSKAWEKYTLKGIASEIAQGAGLGLFYDCDDNPEYARIEQNDITDIALLKKLCQDVGFSLKIADHQVIIFDQRKYEAIQAVTQISFGDGSYTKWDLSTQENGTSFTACVVRWTNPADGKLIEGWAYVDDYDSKDKDNQTLVIKNQRVTSIGEAERVARALLKLNNKFERKAQITLKGNPLLRAGLTVTLSGFGYWDGKYLIAKAKHDFSSNYVTTVTLRRVAQTGESTEEAGGGGGGAGGSNGYWIVTVTRAYVYSRPSTWAEYIVKTLPKGTRVTVKTYNAGGGFAEIEGGYISQGTIGFIK